MKTNIEIMARAAAAENYRIEEIESGALAISLGDYVDDYWTDFAAEIRAALVALQHRGHIITLGVFIDGKRRSVQCDGLVAELIDVIIAESDGPAPGESVH